MTRIWCQNRGMNLYQLVHCTHLDLKNKCTASRQFCLKDAQITDGSKWHPVVYGWDFLLFQGFWGWSVVVICPDGLHTYSLGWNYFVLDSRWVSCMKPILGQKKCRNIWLYLGTHRIHVCVFFLPQFTIFPLPNVGKYTIHGSYGVYIRPWKNSRDISNRNGLGLDVFIHCRRSGCRNPVVFWNDFTWSKLYVICIVLSWQSR